MSPSSHEAQEGGQPRFRVELESHDAGTRRVLHVDARSMEEALVRVRDADRWASDDPGSFRVVEAGVMDGSSELRHDRNARRRYLNTVVESGLTALGRDVPPDRPAGDFADVVCDFFTRAVVLPGRVAFPSEEADAGRLLSSHDDSRVLAQLLAVHLAHHGLKVAPR